MEHRRNLGRELHIVSNLLDRRMNMTAAANGVEGITPVQGMLLGYLSRRKKQQVAVYQRDIEAEFDIARSTVTSLLKLMEKKGYLRREGVSHDARLKRIDVTPAGWEALEKIHSSLLETDQLIRDSLAEGEYDQLMHLLDKVKAVL